MDIPEQKAKVDRAVKRLFELLEEAELEGDTAKAAELRNKLREVLAALR